MMTPVSVSGRGVRLLVVAGAALLASLAAALPAQAQWARGAGGSLPPGATPAGREHHGATLYLCRAEYEGGVHIGKTRPEFRGCNIGWGGREVTLPEYQVYVHALYWREARFGEVPPGSIPAGREGFGQRGQLLYVCRARFNNGVHVGKLRPEFRGCNIGWGGREHTVSTYEVAVGN